MSRRTEKGSLFIGRLSKDIRTRDLDELFEKYGPVDRCDIKYGAEMAYAFVDFADRLDAEDVMKYENGRELLGSEIVIEWAKGNPRRTMVGGGRFSRGSGSDECFRCHRRGHWAKECHSRGPPRGGRWRRSRSRERPRRRARSYSRSRSRSRSRDRKRSRKDSHRKRSRSRSRSPRSASRSRSKSRNRSRSKSPHRSRSKSPRNRSRSKSRGHSKSKSRERERSRSRSLKPDKSPAVSPRNGDDKGNDDD